MTALRSPSARVPMITGPWRGVRNTTDPFDDTDDQLQDAHNCYLPDPFGGSGMYARPGFTLQNPSSALAIPGQGMATHVALDGTVYNLLVSGGKLYRTNAALTTFTDISNGSFPIDATVRRVYLTSFNGQFIISDGVNRPWIAGALGGATVTGTLIQYDAGNSAWSAYGQPVVYGGSLFFVLNAVAGVGRRTDIAWSAPGDPTTGYQQANYDYNWTLEQTGSTPIYALAATNVALFYFRDRSIGAIAGTPGPDLQQSATHDAISVNVGTLQSATVVQYGTTIFFCDAIGRPWMMPIGAKPIPIWLNMRGVVDRSTTSYPTATATVACAAIEPTRQLFLAAIWSPVPGTASSPIELAAFDVQTGTYVGQWTIAPGIAIDAIGVLNDSAGRGALVLLGSKLQAPAASGYVWVQFSSLGDGTSLTTEGGVILLTEGGLALTTESVPATWMDNGVVPAISVQTQRLGYSTDRVLNVDRCAIIAGTAAPCTVTMETPTTASSIEGTPTPAPSADGMFRLVAGAEVQGRGVQVTVSPTTADSQWNAQQVSISGVLSLAGPEDA